MNYYIESFPHLNNKMISLDNLVSAIEELEAKSIISFDEFKELSHGEIQKKYFLMPQYKTIVKAIQKIQDKRDGKTGLSTFETTITTIKNGKTKIKTIIEYY
jgi:hypothetical protein